MVISMSIKYGNTPGPWQYHFVLDAIDTIQIVNNIMT